MRTQPLDCDASGKGHAPEPVRISLTIKPTTLALILWGIIGTAFAMGALICWASMEYAFYLMVLS